MSALCFTNRGGLIVFVSLSPCYFLNGKKHFFSLSLVEIRYNVYDS